ncbi:predicted protein [Botrytis cinerea T4]|uniref:Uncharacterized protein n=1 Tax=Botryotinia fuckeliana (strain T4) TaxID=999810 RepID=G2Y4W0_BOTF4|nr:predicted protein [Botrytis cinerea T4]
MKSPVIFEINRSISINKLEPASHSASSPTCFQFSYLTSSLHRHHNPQSVDAALTIRFSPAKAALLSPS